MTSTSSTSVGSDASSVGLPARLHHNAFVVKDQEVTRRFYEDVIGLPLIATWAEADELFGKERVYCHTFYGLADGGALAFFQFANQSDQDEFGPQFRPSPFIHLALKTSREAQEAIEARLAAAGHGHFTLDHGYAKSLYATDPDGLTIEFTLDHPDADQINATRQASAHEDLARWLGGDHTSNNVYR